MSPRVIACHAAPVISLQSGKHSGGSQPETEAVPRRVSRVSEERRNLCELLPERQMRVQPQMDDGNQLLCASLMPLRGQGKAPKGGEKARNMRNMRKKEFWESEEGLHLAELWAREGEDDAAIAHRMGVPESTLHRWRRDSSELDEVIQRGRAAAWEVESALLRTATGYSKPVTKTYKVKHVEYDPDTGKKVQEKEELQTAEEKVHVPGNTTAQVFWLKNRRPDRWRDKPGLPDNQPEEDDNFFAALAEAMEHEI